MHLLENLKRHAKPGVIAAINGSEQLSYIELCKQSNAFAAYLRENYGDDKSAVVIIGDKQNEVLSLIFGSIMAAHPYVYIPSHYPAKRILDIIEDCGAKVIAAFTDIVAKDCPSLIELYGPDSFKTTFEAYYGQPVPVEEYASDNDLWAIYYTSGSTGIPKGVKLTGESFVCKVNLIDPILSHYYDEDATDILNVSSYAFSITIPTLFYSVVVKGGTLHAVPRSLLGNYAGLFEFMLQVNPHFLYATPSFMEVCLKSPKYSSKYFTRCRYIGFGGEALPSSVVEGVRERFPGIDIVNGYGATETTSAPFLLVVDEKAVDSDVMPVGYDNGMLGNVRIVGDNGEELADGEVGELLLEGPFVSTGYHNRPDLTERAFYETTDGTRGYRTNDLMYRKDNYLYFCGRKDNLVKVGGYRVELEDVEANLRKVDIVQSCVVVPVMHGNSVVMLAAYVTLSDSNMSKIASIGHIKQQLSKLVQSYMVPQRIIILDSLPRTNNGKIDRVRLRQEVALH